MPVFATAPMVIQESLLFPVPERRRLRAALQGEAAARPIRSPTCRAPRSRSFTRDAYFGQTPDEPTRRHAARAARRDEGLREQPRRIRRAALPLPAPEGRTHRRARGRRLGRRSLRRRAGRARARASCGRACGTPPCEAAEFSDARHPRDHEAHRDGRSAREAGGGATIQPEGPHHHRSSRASSMAARW